MFEMNFYELDQLIMLLTFHFKVIIYENFNFLYIYNQHFEIICEMKII
jgi:hypothetical protein